MCVGVHAIQQSRSDAKNERPAVHRSAERWVQMMRVRLPPRSNRAPKTKNRRLGRFFARGSGGGGGALRVGVHAIQQSRSDTNDERSAVHRSAQRWIPRKRVRLPPRSNRAPKTKNRRLGRFFARGSGGGGGALRVGVHAINGREATPRMNGYPVHRSAERWVQMMRVRLPPSNKGAQIAKNRHEAGFLLGDLGGGGGSRTRVRKPSDPGSTCLARSIVSRRHAARGAGHTCRPVAVWFNVVPRNSTRRDPAR